MKKEKSDGQSQFDRRKILAIIGTTAGIFLGGTSLSMWYENRESDPKDTESSTETDAESIKEYGAVENPDDPDPETAAQNLKAISDAATAAGTGGRVYIPSGTYYFGHDGTGVHPYFEFGEREPAGISLVGDGPTKSMLAITGHADPEEMPNQTGFYWNEGHDHGRIEISDLRIDGNYENIGNLSDVGGGSRGLNCSGSGNLYIENVHFRGWHMSPLRGRHLLEEINHCKFESSGIARHNETNGDSISHHISTATPKYDDSVLIKNTLFVDTAGSAVNVSGNDGTIKIYNCYATGTGANFMKLSSGRFVDIQNVYHEAHTESLMDKIEDLEDSTVFYGKNFIQSFGDRGDVAVTVSMKNVKTCDMTDYALQSRDRWEGDPEITWEGDMIAIHNANQVNDDAVIRDRDGGRFEMKEIARLSVHDSEGRVFETPNSDGRIETLRRDGNEGLGETGGIEVRNDEPGQPPFEPDVPSKDSVGLQPTEQGR